MKTKKVIEEKKKKGQQDFAKAEEILDSHGLRYKTYFKGEKPLYLQAIDNYKWFSCDDEKLANELEDQGYKIRPGVIGTPWMIVVLGGIK